MPKPFDVSKVEAGVRLILEGIGEDTSRPGHCRNTATSRGDV